MGALMPGRQFSVSSYRFGFNGKEEDDEVKGDGNQQDYGMRIYDPRLGRFLSRDPMSSKLPRMSPYSFAMNNPNRLIDNNGEFPGLPDKSDVANFITAAAEMGAKLYQKASNTSNTNPYATAAATISAKAFSTAISLGTDLNPKTMGWGDLFCIWIAELGNTNTIYFGPDDKTTQDLKKQEGVLNYRKIALDKAFKGDFSGVNNKSWIYGQKEFYQSINEKNEVTIFLGSYNTSISVVQNKDGSITLNYTVTNTSGWESATRFRKDNDNNGQHDAIIPDKKRGGKVPLGGNLNEVWQWSETIPAPTKENKKKGK
jgi:RHS repeat-associated protein